MPGTRNQWDRYIAAYDLTENARQVFVDKMRGINLGLEVDREDLQRTVTELERLFAEMIAAAGPIIRSTSIRPDVRTELAVA